VLDSGGASKQKKCTALSPKQQKSEDAGEEERNKWRAGSTISGGRGGGGVTRGRRGQGGAAAGRRRHSMQSTAYRMQNALYNGRNVAINKWSPLRLWTLTC